jgi:capsule polysaccharide export protein KpsC/LpsZ
MKCILPLYITEYNLSPLKSEDDANEYGLTFKPDTIDNDYAIFWGILPYKPNFCRKYGVMETGFFNEAAYIDTIGNYQTSSLNTLEAYKEIDNFDLNSKKTAKEIIFNLAPNQRSKYNAEHSEPKNKNLQWKNVVLALQNPSDRSIYSVTTQKAYFEFVENCCKYYGSKLFVKMHPWNSGEIYDQFALIAKKYNCEYGKAPISIIENCEFVISFNSTFAIDCLLREVPYVQYGLGTFYNTYGINYSKQTFPSTVTNIKNASKLCDFLIYKYCFNKQMSKDKYAKMIHHFSKSNEMFPMNDDLCYAYNL